MIPIAGQVIRPGLGEPMLSGPHRIVAVSTASAQKTQMEFWTISLAPLFNDEMNRLVAQFEKENPSVQLTWVDVPAAAIEQKLLAAIAGTGLLVDRNADVTLPDETKRRITGFQVVDEEKLAQLDDETFLSLRKNGALALIYCHLISMRNWRNIVGGAK